MTNCANAQFSAETCFDDHFPNEWANLSEAERDAARAPWIARGMINVDAPPRKDDEGG